MGMGMGMGMVGGACRVGYVLFVLVVVQNWNSLREVKLVESFFRHPFSSCPYSYLNLGLRLCSQVVF